MSELSWAELGFTIGLFVAFGAIWAWAWINDKENR